MIDNEPTGAKYVFISNKICKMYVIPRTRLEILSKYDDLQHYALYILLGEDDETAKQKAYIGETDNVHRRILNHNSKKDFWQKALVFVSKDSEAELTKTDVKYLEFRAVALAKEVGSYALDDSEGNVQTPQEPHLSEYKRESDSEFFDDICFLTSFLGYRIFDKVKVASTSSVTTEDKELFYFKEAKGYYMDDGFVVLKGSKVNYASVPSLIWKDKRDKMISEYTTRNGNISVVESDIVFGSPSMAASFCSGNSKNGWISWKNSEGKTLDELYRSPK